MEFLGTQQEWNTYTSRQPHAQFLQSYEWGLFQRALGRRVWYLQDKKKEAMCLVVRYPLTANTSYLMCPRGPIGNPDASWWNEFFGWAKTTGTLFVRVEPLEESDVAKGLRHVRDVQPAVTRIIDLTQPASDILAHMHSKTRYNINLSQKKELEVTTVAHNKITEEDLNQWWVLSQETAQRNSISVHPFEYYKTLFSTFPYITLSTIHLKDEVVAMTIHVGFGDTMYYLYGASSHTHKDVMAPYYVQWHAIQTAKQAGYHYYDLWGTAPTDDPKHLLAGVTRFKKGFGGEVIHYPGTFDMPFKMIPYYLYSIARTIRRAL